MASADSDSQAMTSYELGDLFEKEVRIFLERIGLKNVDGGPGFNICLDGKSNQIDACGVYGQTLFVVECRASENRDEDLKLKIERFRDTQLAEIRAAFEGNPKFSACNRLCPIFATRGIKIKSKDLGILEDANILHIDENFLDYYNSLIDTVGEYALYSFLADCKVFLDKTEQLTAFAIRQTISGRESFLFFADPKQLLKVAYVARRGYKSNRDRNDEFYQRLLESSRLEKIRKFIDSGGFFPTNIILSLKSTRTVRGYSFFSDQNIKTDLKGFPSGYEFGILRTKLGYGSCWIIDGQHRLYSYAKFG